jgi:hypothetical protein
MKKIYCILFALFILVACKKTELGSDNGCISQIKKHYIGGADSLAAVQLLKANNIPYTNLAFENISLHDTVNNADGTHVYQSIFALQYFNGLPVLSDAILYTFVDGIHKITSGTSYSSINLNTRASLTLPQLRKLYIAALNKNNTLNAASYKDSCLVAQLGYYNLNVTKPNTAANFIKVWYVSPQHTLFPSALFRDDNGQTINFDTGFVFVN